jgi:hypothetical protein
MGIYPIDSGQWSQVISLPNWLRPVTLSPLTYSHAIRHGTRPNWLRSVTQVISLPNRLRSVIPCPFHIRHWQSVWDSTQLTQISGSKSSLYPTDSGQWPLALSHKVMSINMGIYPIGSGQWPHVISLPNWLRSVIHYPSHIRSCQSTRGSTQLT